MRTPNRAVAAGILASLAACAWPSARAIAQPEDPPRKEAAPVEVTAQLKIDAVQQGVGVILKLQQGKDNAEWPYEGVYRVRGQIPWGYRVGGTAICALALMEAPGYADDETRKEAVKRAVKFICESRTEKDLAVDTYGGGYDVRSWGHIEAVATFARMKQQDAIPAGMEKDVEEAVAFYLDAVHKLEVPKAGGWNYATNQYPSSFMTSRALQALFEAAAAGYAVDPEVVKRALDFLEKTRFATGSVAYSNAAGAREPRKSDAVPGATGRMCSVESTLLLAGRGSPANVRASCDGFIVHWEWLDKRRARTGTHTGPYAVAPYYFMFAHYYAALAAELLPSSEKGEYRRHINDLLFSVRQEDGSWNDRVFERSAAYSTAMAIMAITAPDRRPPATWPVRDLAAKEGGGIKEEETVKAKPTETRP
jgi:hypothetical protein